MRAERVVLKKKKKKEEKIHILLVSPRHSKVREYRLDGEVPQIVVKKPENWEEFYLTVAHRG